MRAVPAQRLLGAVVAIVVGPSCGGRSQLTDDATPSGAPIACTSSARAASPTITLSAGAGSTCAIDADGAVKCWGRGREGQLGDGSMADSAVPVDVAGLSTGAIAVATGGSSSCALTAAGAVECWGWNHHGELGNGSTTASPVPVDVVGLSACASAVSTGMHTCALTAEGAARCWGLNSNGELGNDSYTDSHVPVEVAGLSSGVIGISVGGVHTCAVSDLGAVKCWGWRSSGQLGNGYGTETGLVPVDVVGLSYGVIAVSSGYAHTCALTAAGAVKCWGRNREGQLGNGSITDSHLPVDVMGLSSGVIAIAAGWTHTCALTSAGSVKCWGSSILTLEGPVPVDVVGLPSGVVAISAGTNHTCAATSAGTIHCWGWNLWGQLGDGTTTDSPVPVDVVGL